MKRLRDLTAVLGMVALTACNNASIEGSWVEPVPGMPGMQQGFVLDGDGSASSINMATLKYEAWKKVGNRLLLSGTSIGNQSHLFRITDTIIVHANCHGVGAGFCTAQCNFSLAVDISNGGTALSESKACAHICR